MLNIDRQVDVVLDSMLANGGGLRSLEARVHIDQWSGRPAHEKRWPE